MLLSDLLDVDLLFEHVRDGYVTGRSHPDALEGLTVWNYTPKCQFDRAWDGVTTRCRGLITRSDQTVVARPWPKFWNYGEHEEGTLDLDAPAQVLDKLDGSLGILYPTRGGYAIATRGSFESEQAVHATELWRGLYSQSFDVDPALTYLYEVVYPANRIVVDYGTTDDLVLLGVLDTETGAAVDATSVGWPGPRAEPAPASTLRAALALPPRRNAEGLVVRFEDGLMLKIKQEDYIALHRIVTGLNERVVWERLGAGELLEDVQRGLPEEFAEWVADVYVGLTFRADSIYYDVRDTYRTIVGELNEPETVHREWSRKDFAERALRHPDISTMLFLMLDEKPIKDAIWRLVKPPAKAPRDFEAAA